jgi:hypothetical protein
MLLRRLLIDAFRVSRFDDSAFSSMKEEDDCISTGRTRYPHDPHDPHDPHVLFTCFGTGSR